MGRQPTHYIVPKSGRVSTTLGKRELKGIRKISIDLGMPEGDVLKLAVRALIEKYDGLSVDDIEATGIACFVQNTDGFGAESEETEN